MKAKDSNEQGALGDLAAFARHGVGGAGLHPPKARAEVYVEVSGCLNAGVVWNEL